MTSSCTSAKRLGLNTRTRSVRGRSKEEHGPPVLSGWEASGTGGGTQGTVGFLSGLPYLILFIYVVDFVSDSEHLVCDLLAAGK